MATRRSSKEPTKRRVATKVGDAKKHTAQPAQRHARQAVAIDEARARVGEDPRAYSIKTPHGVDALGEELGETFVEDVTGADDAATEHRADDALDDDGGPFVITTGAEEFASGTDASNPADAECEAVPTVSDPGPR